MVPEFMYFYMTTSHLLEVALRIYRQDLERAEGMIEFAQQHKRSCPGEDLEVLTEDIRKVQEVIQHYRRTQKSPAGGQTDEAKTETTTKEAQ